TRDSCEGCHPSSQAACARVDPEPKPERWSTLEPLHIAHPGYTLETRLFIRGNCAAIGLPTPLFLSICVALCQLLRHPHRARPADIRALQDAAFFGAGQRCVRCR